MFGSERHGMFVWDMTFFSALRGLSSALSKLHRLYLNKADHKVQFEAIGYHHDIRSANILVNSETFILGDFGMGNYKPVDAQSQTPWKWAIGDYLAPECTDENHKPQDVGRGIDIWAFGCLLSEVVTYMLTGSTGIQDFRAKRELPSRVPGWTDCGFYRQDGNVKEEVKDWLANITQGANSDGSPWSLLAELSLQALTGDPKDRPKITDICAALSVASMKAHFNAVDIEFINHSALVFSASQDPDSQSKNNVWLLQERFRAWGHALTLQRSQTCAQTLSTIDALHDKSIECLVALFQVLRHSPFSGSTNSSLDEQSLFEGEVDAIVERLWDCLPYTLHENAQNYWHQAILRTNDSVVLEDLQHKLRAQYMVYDITNAMAMMKKLRLKMLQPDSLVAAASACTLASKDIHVLHAQCQHALGRYKESLPILIERFRYAPAWENIDPVQRELVTSLKARGFGIEPKPKGLRMLNCMGVYHDTAKDGIYGFVYSFPPGAASAPKTLLQYLDQGDKDPWLQPDLGDRFQLAFALADFLQQFHTIGWLHENFNPHNVLFFERSEPQDEGAPALSPLEVRSPYIVGLYKSRPDGEFWQTSGPTADDSLHDYQHPEYSASGRYSQYYDYYSLGIILLEIGLWRSLKSMLSRQKVDGLQSTDLGAVEIRMRLLQTAQERLGSKMGTTYRDAVVRCLDTSLETNCDSPSCELGAEGTTEPKGKTTAFESLVEGVVEPLRKLAMAPV